MMVFVFLRRCAQFVFGTDAEITRGDHRRAPAFWYLHGR
jgi:hypothetical protein